MTNSAPAVVGASDGLSSLLQDNLGVFSKFGLCVLVSLEYSARNDRRARIYTLIALTCVGRAC